MHQWVSSVPGYYPLSKLEKAYATTIFSLPSQLVHVPSQTIFPHAEGKIVWSTAYSIFVPSLTMVALQSDYFMQVKSRTAINGDQRRLGGQSVMQKTKPGRTREQTSEGMPGLLWTGGVCFWACQLAVWSSWASNVKYGCLRVTLREVSRFVSLCFLVFRSSKKMIPATSGLFTALS